MRWNCLRDLAIHARQDAVQKFDDDDFRAEPAPDRAELEPDDAGADDEKLLRHLRERRARRSRRRPAFSSIATPGSGATSEPVAMTIALRFERLLRAVRGRHFDLTRRFMIRPAPKKRSILFFFNRKATPLTLARDGVVLVLHHRERSSCGLPTTTPKRGEVMRGLSEFFRGMEQRLRGNAADVEAGAAEGRPLLDDGDFHAELRRADGADIAAGAGADDDEIVLALAILTELQRREPRRILQRFLDAHEEGHRLLAVDDAVIVGEREIHHRADFDLAADRRPGAPGSCACRECRTAAR